MGRFITRTTTTLAAASLLLALGAGTAGAANNAVCMGQLARTAQGHMPHVADDWRTDFLGLGAPGFYAAHLTTIRSECPLPPP